MHETRMELYQQGLTDKEIALIVGVKSAAIWAWRKKLGLKRDKGLYNRNCPMEQALTPDQCHQMKYFLAKMIATQDLYPSRKLDVNQFMQDYREGDWRERVGESYTRQTNVVIQEGFHGQQNSTNSWG